MIFKPAYLTLVPREFVYPRSIFARSPSMSLRTASAASIVVPSRSARSSIDDASRLALLSLGNENGMTSIPSSSRISIRRCVFEQSPSDTPMMRLRPGTGRQRVQPLYPRAEIQRKSRRLGLFNQHPPVFVCDEPVIEVHRPRPRREYYLHRYRGRYAHARIVKGCFHQDRPAPQDRRVNIH